MADQPDEVTGGSPRISREDIIAQLDQMRAELAEHAPHFLEFEPEEAAIVLHHSIQQVIQQVNQNTFGLEQLRQIITGKSEGGVYVP